MVDRPRMSAQRAGVGPDRQLSALDLVLRVTTGSLMRRPCAARFDRLRVPNDRPRPGSHGGCGEGRHVAGRLVQVFPSQAGSGPVASRRRGGGGGRTEIARPLSVPDGRIGGVSGIDHNGGTDMDSENRYEWPRGATQSDMIRLEAWLAEHGWEVDPTVYMVARVAPPSRYGGSTRLGPTGRQGCWSCPRRPCCGTACGCESHPGPPQPRGARPRRRRTKGTGRRGHGYHLTGFVWPELPDVLALAVVVAPRGGA